MNSYELRLAAGEPLTAFMNREAAHVADLAADVGALADHINDQNFGLRVLHEKAQSSSLQESLIPSCREASC